MTAEQLYEIVQNTLASAKGWTELGPSLGSVKTLPGLRWANPLEIKNAVEKVFLEKFGPKTAAPPKAKVCSLIISTRERLFKVSIKAAKNSVQDKEKASTEPAPPRKSVFEEGFLGSLHKPGGNPQIKPELREQHLAATGGQVWTRFPPEPNGYLHVGHSKAIFVNFGYAAHHGGKCYLRYDDTNPEKEKEEYFESILETVRWLGFEPWKITYSSDNFDKLYELAVELIKRDKAYVCHCTRTCSHLIVHRS
jgi:glutaminyl-tRNA synthetase